MSDTDLAKLIKWYSIHQNPTEMRKKAGNAFWNYQHTIAEWTKPDKEHNLKLFDNLKSGVKNFPCERCATKGMMWIDSNPIGDEDFKHYVWKFHNRVNEKLEKPQFPYPETYQSKCVPKAVVEKFIEMGEEDTLNLLMEGTPMCEV